MQYKPEANKKLREEYYSQTLGLGPSVPHAARTLIPAAAHNKDLVDYRNFLRPRVPLQQKKSKEFL